MQIEDLENITKLFDFEVLEDQTFFGFGAWFDAIFKSSFHKTRVVDVEPIVLSTSPWEQETHWKQDLWIFEKHPWPIKVSKGQRITGKIEILRNTYWRRHYIIHITLSVEGKEYTKTWNRWREP